MIRKRQRAFASPHCQQRALPVAARPTRPSSVVSDRRYAFVIGSTPQPRSRRVLRALLAHSRLPNPQACTPKQTALDICPHQHTSGAALPALRRQQTAIGAGLRLVPSTSPAPSPHAALSHPTRHFTIAVASHKACLVRQYSRAQHHTPSARSLHLHSRPGRLLFGGLLQLSGLYAFFLGCC